MNIQKIKKIINEKGLFGLFSKLRYSIKINLFGFWKAIVFQLDLEKKYPQVDTGLPLSFRYASEQDIDSMDDKHYNLDEKSKEYLKERFKENGKTILAVYNNKIVGYLCLILDQMELAPNKFKNLQKNKAYTYKGFVLEEYRGRRIHSAMYSQLVKFFKKEGKRYVISTVDEDNKPALKTKLKNRADYEIIGTLIHIRFFGLKFDYIPKRYLGNI